MKPINDKTVPKYATHLVYLTNADNPKEIEHKIIYSILNKKPKRADIYWFVHVYTLDDPYTAEYEVTHIIPNDIHPGGVPLRIPGTAAHQFIVS